MVGVVFVTGCHCYQFSVGRAREYMQVYKHIYTNFSVYMIICWKPMNSYLRFQLEFDTSALVIVILHSIFPHPLWALTPDSRLLLLPLAGLFTLLGLWRPSWAAIAPVFPVQASSMPHWGCNVGLPPPFLPSPLNFPLGQYLLSPLGLWLFTLGYVPFPWREAHMAWLHFDSIFLKQTLNDFYESIFLKQALQMIFMSKPPWLGSALIPYF